MSRGLPAAVQQHRVGRWVLTALVLAATSLLLYACIFRQVMEQQRKLDALCTLEGQVRAENMDHHPLVVVLVRAPGDDSTEGAQWELVDRYVLEGAGHWSFRVEPGTYGLAAFEDSKPNLAYEPGELALQVAPQQVVNCGADARIDNLHLVIPADGTGGTQSEINIAHLQGRPAAYRLRVSLGAMTAAGEVASLDDPRFDVEHARQGLWRPFDFLFEAHPGVYFLEPYSREKTPVLFVHGMEGTPADFRYLIGHLDRSGFEPWVYYYPSGDHLNAVVGRLDQTIKQLQLRYGFRQLVLVAHSMGGLVARGFLLRNQAEAGRIHIPLFVSISTPWGGVQAAAKGVKFSPAAVWAWEDVSPKSAYLRNLFFSDPDRMARHRPLPAGTEYHLLFGFRRDSRSRGDSDDQSVTVASQLYPGAQQDATRLYGFDATHESILETPEVSRLLNRLLHDATP